MINLKEFINKIKNVSLIVVGDVMLDEHLWCRVNRISPEAPIPVAEIEKVSLMPGGAGNVANNVRALGANVELIGIIGRDSSAEKLLKELRERKIGCKFLIRDKKRPTTLKSRIIAHHQHVVRVDREEKTDISKNLTENIIKEIGRILPRYEGIILSDYGKGFLNKDLCQGLVSEARKYKKVIAIDPKGNDYQKYKRATFITPNKRELENVLKENITDNKKLIKAAVRLKKKLELKYIIITRSEEGMTVIDINNTPKHLPVFSQDVYDITGAGDTVISALTLGLVSGLNIVEAAKAANYIAGIVVNKVGTAVVTAEELIKYEKQKKIP